MSFYARNFGCDYCVRMNIDAALERHFWRWAAVLSVLLLACSLANDIRRKMWTDEFFTLYMAQQDGFDAIVKATANGSDGAPPLYSTVVHSILPFIHDDALSIRLPSTLACCGMFLFLLA